MTEPAYSNKRIAKNTLMLYLRMFLTMAISLYTSRVVLSTLGIEDYGTYNVVGGVVVMFTFINGAMSTATMRYITFELGRGNIERLKTVFRTSIQVFVILAFIIVLLSETIGLWFLYHKLTIAPDRMTAALWVFQISIIDCVLRMIVIPFNAEVISHEKMSTFAYLSILDVTLKLIIVYLLQVIPFDKLIIYALLMFAVSIIHISIYLIYCFKHFPEINFQFRLDKPLLKEMTSFAGWGLFGNLAGVLYNQGLNMLLNIFFGPVVNAARGVALQVQGTVQSFIVNFQMALNPQITKSYAKGNLDRMHTLIFTSSKFSFFLLFILALPITIEANQILGVWLKEVPNHSVSFIRLLFSIALIETLANPLVISNQATGKVKKYQIVVGGIQLLIVPIAYIVLKLGGNPESVYLVQFVIMLCAQIARIFMIKPLIQLPLKKYFNEVIVRVLIVAITAPIIPLFIYFNTHVMSTTNFFMVCLFSVISVFISIYLIGITQNERQMILSYLQKRIKR